MASRVSSLFWTSLEESRERESSPEESKARRESWEVTFLLEEMKWGMPFQALSVVSGWSRLRLNCSREQWV